MKKMLEDEDDIELGLRPADSSNIVETYNVNHSDVIGDVSMVNITTDT